MKNLTWCVTVLRCPFFSPFWPFYRCELRRHCDNHKLISQSQKYDPDVDLRGLSESYVACFLDLRDKTNRLTIGPPRRSERPSRGI